MNGKMGQAPPAGDQAEVARRHDGAVAGLERADQNLRDLQTALVMRRIDYERALPWHDRMMAQIRDQLRRRAIDTSPERLKEIERISERHEQARRALAAAQDAWDQGSADHAAFTARLWALHYARLLSGLAGAFPADAAAARLARAWTDYALGRPGAKRPSVLQTADLLDRARSGQMTTAGPPGEPVRVRVPPGWLIEVPTAPPRPAPPPAVLPPAPRPTSAERVRAIRPPYAPPPVVQPTTSIAPPPAGPTAAVWGPRAAPPWVFRLPTGGVQVALPLT